MPTVNVPAVSFVQRVGAYGVCICVGAILLSRYSPPDGRWVLPGGGVDHGEHPEDAIVREVKEETGYQVELDRLLGVESGTWTAPDLTSIHSVNVLYLFEVVGGELAYEIGGSSDSAAWVPLAELEDWLHASVVDQALKRFGL